MKLYLHWLIVFLLIASAVMIYVRGVEVNQQRAEIERLKFELGRRPPVAALKTPDGDVWFMIKKQHIYRFDNLCGYQKT